MDITKLLDSFKNTLLMTFVSAFLAYIVGLPLGLLLYATGKNGLVKNKFLNYFVGIIVNILRSIPCLLLIVLLFPLSNALLKGYGSWTSMIIPLFFASFPFVARMVEQSLQEVDKGVIEASRSLGANNFKIMFNVLLVEARPSLISGLAVSLVSILGYTAFAYDIGAGGLISYAYTIFNNSGFEIKSIEIWVVIAFIVLIVQIIQELGIIVSSKLDKRRKLS